MIDPITQRSALIATCIHACLLVLAFAPRGCSTKESDEPIAQTSPTVKTVNDVKTPIATSPPAKPMESLNATSPPPMKATKVTKATPVYASIIAVPQRATKAPPLPALGSGDLPALPPIGDIIVAVNQDHADSQPSSKGQQERGTGLVNLPSLPLSQDDLIARLQGQRTSNQTLSREQRMLASAQEFLHGRLQTQIQQKWQHLLPKVTESRLIIECRVNDRGTLIHARLVNSSGSLTLDRLIDEWLMGSKLSLPPITPNITYPFLIVIPHT